MSTTICGFFVIQSVCFPFSLMRISLDSCNSSGENLCENGFLDSRQNSSPVLNCELQWLGVSGMFWCKIGSEVFAIFWNMYRPSLVLRFLWHACIGYFMHFCLQYIIRSYLFLYHERLVVKLHSKIFSKMLSICHY